MDQSDCDITNYAWLDHDSIGFPFSHIESLCLFREKIVQSSLHSLDEEITKLQGGDDPASVFLADDYASLFQTTVEGYLIAVQSMWERGLRAMLIQRASKLNQSSLTLVLERAVWGGKSPNLQDHFLTLMGVPISVFDSYPDIDVLQCLGSAIRHGDGASARRLHQICPNLWFNWIPPGQEIVAGPFRIVAPQDGPKTPSFSSITLPEVVLGQMIQSVMWFWEDIENMRLNSFRVKNSAVVEKIAEWHVNRACRHRFRIWNQADGVFQKAAPF